MNYSKITHHISNKPYHGGSVSPLSSEVLAQTLISKAPIPIIFMDADTSILYVNAAFEVQTGFNFAEVVGRRPPYPWWTPEMPERFAAGVARARASGSGAYRVETMFKKKNGNKYWVEVTSAVVGSWDHPDYFIATWIDSTERKLIEEELRRSEETARTLLDAAPDSAMLIDLKGKIIALNRIAAKRIGETKKLTLESNLVEILPATRLVAIKKAISEAVRTKKRVRYEDEYDGRIYSSEIRPVFDASKGVTRLALFERDITQRKLVEEKLNEGFHQIVSSIRTFIPAPTGPVPAKLSPREATILRLVAEGKTTKEIAAGLNLSTKTVETFRRHVMDKLELYSVAELTKYAIREGLTSL